MFGETVPIETDGDLRLHRIYDALGRITSEQHYDSFGDPVAPTDPAAVDPSCRQSFLRNLIPWCPLCPSVSSLFFSTNNHPR